ncbi:MAG: hypothetical protein AB1633_07645 [Elusimicrobiota bacterium]
MTNKRHLTQSSRSLCGCAAAVAILSFFLLFFFVPNSHALFDNLIRSARPAGMGGAFTAVVDDENALYWNPSGLSLINNPGISTMYESLFGISDLNHVLFSGILPVKGGTAGVSYIQFGSSFYKEQTLGLSYGFNLGEMFSAGATLNSYSLSITGDEYGSSSAVGVDIGLLARISDNLRAGVYFKNFNNPSVGVENRIALPQTINVGLAYNVFPGFLFSVDMGRDTGFDTDLRAGFEYKLSNVLTLRTGALTVPARFSAGFGLRMGVVAFDYAMLTHPYLDTSHQVNFLFRFLRVERKQETEEQQAPEVDEFGY